MILEMRRRMTKAGRPDEDGIVGKRIVGPRGGIALN